jgi:hypothetical protein
MRATAFRQLALGACALIVLAAALLGKLPELAQALVYLLPALLLLAAVALRRYPGERTLLALIGTRPHRPRRRRQPTRLPDRRPRAMLPRGARLIAFSLAVRPPPLRTVRVS